MDGECAEANSHDSDGICLDNVTDREVDVGAAMVRVAACPDARLDGNAVRPWALGRQFRGRVTVLLRCGSSCPTVHVGNYVEVDGEKVHEQFYEVESVTVVR